MDSKPFSATKPFLFSPQPSWLHGAKSKVFGILTFVLNFIPLLALQMLLSDAYDEFASETSSGSVAKEVLRFWFKLMKSLNTSSYSQCCMHTYMTRNTISRWLIVVCCFKIAFSVDGRNPTPVDMVDISIFSGFHTSQVVVWDFFHQQYHFMFRTMVKSSQHLPTGTWAPPLPSCYQCPWCCWTRNGVSAMSLGMTEPVHGGGCIGLGVFPSTLGFMFVDTNISGWWFQTFFIFTLFGEDSHFD